MCTIRVIGVGACADLRQERYRESAFFAAKVARLLTIVVVMFCIVPALATIVPGLTTSVPPASAATGGATASGYWLVASDGRVFTYGDALLRLHRCDQP